MAFHIKKTNFSKDVFYKGNSIWTDEYADRKSYSSNSLAQDDIDEMSSPLINNLARPKVTGTIVEE